MRSALSASTSEFVFVAESDSRNASDKGRVEGPGAQSVYMCQRKSGGGL